MISGKPSYAPSKLQRYGLALFSVAVALGMGHFLAGYNVKGVEFPVFLLAIALTIWYAGTGPGILALLLSAVAFNYFFTEPRYSFYITRADVPYYAVFILFALLVTWLSSARRRVERELLRSHDELQKEVAIRTRLAASNPIRTRPTRGRYMRRSTRGSLMGTIDEVGASRIKVINRPKHASG